MSVSLFVFDCFKVSHVRCMLLRWSIHSSRHCALSLFCFVRMINRLACQLRLYECSTIICDCSSWSINIFVWLLFLLSYYTYNLTELCSLDSSAKSTIWLVTMFWMDITLMSALHIPPFSIYVYMWQKIHYIMYNKIQQYSFVAVVEIKNSAYIRPTGIWMLCRWRWYLIAL